MKRIKDLIDWFKGLEQEQKKFALIIILLIPIVTFLLVDLLIGAFFVALSGPLSMNKKFILLYGVQSGMLPITIFCTLVIVYLILMIVSQTKSVRNFIGNRDMNGIDYMERGQLGRAHYIDEDELHNFFMVRDVNDHCGNPSQLGVDPCYASTIYGKIDNKTIPNYTPKSQHEIAALPAVKPDAEQNVMIIGSVGTGKSYCYVRSEIINTILRRDAGVVTDPSGELLRDIGGFAIQQGYELKVLNLDNPNLSNFWNCLEETISVTTERLDSTKLTSFVLTFLKNSGQEEGFWNMTTQNLLGAAIGFKAFEREKFIMTQLSKLYAHIVPSTHPGRRETRALMDASNPAMTSITWCKQQILDAGVQYGADINAIYQTFAEIEEAADHAKPFSLPAVFDFMKDDFIKAEEEGWFDSIPLAHPAKIAFDIYKQGSSNSNVKTSSILNTLLTLQIFSDESLKRVLSHRDIDLRQLNRKSSGRKLYFIKTSEKSTALTCIASLFFTFLFQDTMNTWDTEMENCGGNLDTIDCVSTSVILDEFFSLGVICGNSKDFATIMSTARKRAIHVSIILQNIGQLAQRYGDDATNIESACGTKMYLGGNDLETFEYISNLCGEATVANVSHREMESKGLTALTGHGTADFDASYSVSATKRQLITIDDARRSDRVYILRKNAPVLSAAKFPWTEHPCADAVKATNLKLEQFTGSVFDIVNAQGIAWNEKMRGRKIETYVMEDCIEGHQYYPSATNANTMDTASLNATAYDTNSYAEAEAVNNFTQVFPQETIDADGNRYNPATGEIIPEQVDDLYVVEDDDDDFAPDAVLDAEIVDAKDMDDESIYESAPPTGTAKSSSKVDGEYRMTADDVDSDSQAGRMHKDPPSPNYAKPPKIETKLDKGLRQFGSTKNQTRKLRKNSGRK